MLTALATRLLTALDALPGQPTLRLGGPEEGDAPPLIYVHATQLAPESGDGGSSAGPVTPRKIVRWAADGAQTDFPLPEVVAQVLEVRSPPGRRVLRGEQFEVTPAGTLSFQRAPKDDVVAELAEPARRGWQSQSEAQLSLELGALSRDPAFSERLLMRALGCVIEVLGEEDVFAMEPPEPEALRLRFLLQRFQVTSLRAGPRAQGDERLHASVAQLRLRGQVEMSVVWQASLGEPLIELGQAEETWGEETRDGPRPASDAPEGEGRVHNPLADEADAVELSENQPREIEGAPLSVIGGVGHATAAKLSALTGADTLGGFAALELTDVEDLSVTGLSNSRVRSYHAQARVILALTVPAEAPAALTRLDLQEASALSPETLAKLSGRPRLPEALAEALEALGSSAREGLTLADFQPR